MFGCGRMRGAAIKENVPENKIMGLRGTHYKSPRTKRGTKRHLDDDEDDAWQSDVDDDGDESDILSEEDPEWLEQSKTTARKSKRSRVRTYKAAANAVPNVKVKKTPVRKLQKHEYTDICHDSGVLRPDNKERMLLRPWLIDQIEKGETEGLEWMDEQKTLAKIPWIHGSSQKWNITESILFTNWAKHSGRYGDNTSNDPKRWKANFRCALNSLPDVKEAKHLSVRKGANAYKVYKFHPAQVRRSELKKEEREKRQKTGKGLKLRSRESVHEEYKPKVQLPVKQCLDSPVPPCPTDTTTTRILPDPVVNSQPITPPAIFSNSFSPLLDAQSLKTPPASPDHSYAQSNHLPFFSPDNMVASTIEIPTTVGQILQDEYVKTPRPTIRLGSGPTALEAVCPKYSLNRSSSKASSESESSGDDSAFSEISAESPMSDITEEEIQEIISEMETFKDPTALFNKMQASSSNEENEEIAVETQLLENYSRTIVPSLILQPTAIIEERLQNEGMTYTNMSGDFYSNYNMVKPMVTASIC